MPVTFSKTLRALRSDRIPWNWAILAVLGLLPLVTMWLFLAKISVYEVSTSASMEVLRAPQSLTAAVEGQVLSSNLRLGLDVSVDDVLVTLDDKNVRRLLDEPQQIIIFASKRLTELAKELRARQEAIDALEKGVALAKAQAQTQLEVAESRYRRASQRVAREETLLAANALAKDEIDASRAEKEAAAGLVKAAGLAIEQGEQALLAEKHQEQADLEVAQQQRAGLEGEIAAQEVRLRNLEHELELRKIRAPVTGKVADVVPFRVGDVIKLGEKLATIVPPGRSRLVAQLPVTAVGRVVPGQSARLRLDGFPWTQYGTLSAKVTGVGTEPSHGSIRVELEVPADQNPLITVQHGQSGTVEIEVERVYPAILILRAAGQQLTTRRTAVSK